MKNTLHIIFILFLTTSAIAQSKYAPEVPDTMVQFLDEIESLQPLMVSREEFSSRKNEFNIQTRLNHLDEISRQLKHESRLSTPFFKVMTDILPQHLSELSGTFKSGDKERARGMLNATLDGCSTCHSQLKAKHANLWKFNPDTIKGTNFEKAEFLFAVRQYDEALPLYKKVIEKFRPTSIEPINQEVQDSLYRKQSILVRSKRNLEEAKKEIENDLGRQTLPEPVKVMLRNNLASIKELEKVSVPNVDKAKSIDVENFAAITLNKSMRMGNHGVISQMFVSNILYDFVQRRPVSEIGPGIYYWLAKCEKNTNKSYFFPVAEFYLRECINRFPSSIEAKLCFNEMENLLRYDDYARK